MLKKKEILYLKINGKNNDVIMWLYCHAYIQNICNCTCIIHTTTHILIGTNNTYTQNNIRARIVNSCTVSCCHFFARHFISLIILISKNRLFILSSGHVQFAWRFCCCVHVCKILWSPSASFHENKRFVHFLCYLY